MAKYNMYALIFFNEKRAKSNQIDSALFGFYFVFLVKP